MATAHLGALRKDPRVHLVALASRTPERARQMADVYGMVVAEDWRELLRMELDAIYVLTPDHLHRDMALAVLEAGIHLFLEKSLERNLHAAHEILCAGQAARARGVQTLVAYPLRFDPHYRKLHELVTAPEAGKPLYGSSVRTHFLAESSRIYDKYRGETYSPPDWYFSRACSGGPIYSHGSHDYDLMRWFLRGEVASVFAVGRQGLVKKGDIYDAFSTTLEFDNGAVASVSTPWVTRVEFDLVTAATENITAMNQNNHLRWCRDEGAEEQLGLSFDLWKEVNGHFIDLLEGRTMPWVTLEDAFAAVVIATAALRSAEEGRKIMTAEIKAGIS